MTQKLVFISEDHRKAVKKYMKLSQRDNVVPLPIMNKIETKDNVNTLSLEDYTINEGQAKCLGQCLGKYGLKAFSKIYLYNNGLKDKGL